MTYFIFSRPIWNVIAALLALFLLALLAGQATAQGLADARFDLTGNGVIDDADAAMVLSAIAVLQEEGVCLSSELANRDINGDGCVDIFDVQIVLAHWGERTQPEPPQPLIVPAAATTFTVNSNGDSSDANLGDSACNTGGVVTINDNSSPECTLRAAIQQSNASSGTDTINFNIRNSDGSCPGLVTIETSGLVIDAPDDAGVTINGYSQCGASPNTQPINGNAVIKIEIKGPKTSGSTGLAIYSAKNTIKGLAIYRSKENVWLETGGAKRNTIQGNILGSNANLTWGFYGKGLSIRHGATYNLVGGVAPAERNIVSGFDGDGIPMRDSQVMFNVVIGNYIGVKQDGKSTTSSKGDGIDIQAGTRYNWIGASPPGWIASGATSSSAINWPPAGAQWPPAGFQDGDAVPSPDPNRVYDVRERNIISSVSGDGVEVTHQTNTKYNYIVNNYIGIDASGTIAVGNKERGVNLEDGLHHHFIYDNVIVNNSDTGIVIQNVSDYNEVVDNYIGVAPNGVTPMGNGTNPDINERFGVLIVAASQHNLIKNNIIANHPKHGVVVDAHDGWATTSHQTYYNTISQNSIYNNGNGGFSGEGIHFESEDGWEPNQDIAAPQITSANQLSVAGTACANCTVEVFVAQINDSWDSNDGGEGKTYLNTGTANGSGNFSIPISGVSVGQKVTATATDASGNTSEFAKNVEVSDSQIPLGYVLLNGGTGLQSVYNDVLAQFWATDNVNITAWRYKVDAPFAGEGFTSITPIQVFSTNVPLNLSTGPHTIYAQYQDNSGNVSAVYDANITIVNVGDPNPARVTINNGDLYTNNPDLALQLVGPLYASNMKIGEISTLNGSDWQPYSLQSGWTLGNPPIQSQTVNIYAKFKDANGGETSIVSDNILFDPVAPTLSASFNGATKVISLTGTKDDTGGSGLDQMRFYNQSFPAQDTGWIAYQTSYTWPYSGSAEIVVEVKDKAGNIEDTSDNPFVVSGPPPSLGIYLPIIIR